MAKEIKTIVYEGTIEKKSEKSVRRVAAYCRVSTLQEEQELSYESQCEYFKKMIEGRADMELVDVYGDHGISGLHADKRPELQRMLADAREGKIDLIMVKSISRLSRNMIEFQEIVNEMKELGITIEFEKENLKSDDPQFEMVVKFLAACAQEESNSISQSITWAHARNNRLGTPTRGCPFGFRKKPRKRGEVHVWEICEPEAKLVRLAFSLAKARTNPLKISKILKEEQKKYPELKQRKWTSATVKYMLRNEAYIGDVLTAKTYTPDYISGKGKINQGEREQYYLQEHHPAIVSRELFAEVGAFLEAEEGA